MCIVISILQLLYKNLVFFLHSQAEQELRMSQSEFDRQSEITRLLLEGVSSTHVCNSAQLSTLYRFTNARKSLPYLRLPLLIIIQSININNKGYYCSAAGFWSQKLNPKLTCVCGSKIYNSRFLYECFCLANLLG